MIIKFTEFNESLFQNDTTGQNYDEKGENLIVQQDEDLPFYDRMKSLLDRANVIYCKYKGDDPDDWTITTANTAKDCLLELDPDNELYDEAQDLYDEIENLEDERDEKDEEEMLDREEEMLDREYDDNDDDDDDDNEKINENKNKDNKDNEEDVSKKDQKKLFDALESLGFSRNKTDFNKTIFKHEDEIFIFPQHLQKRHFYATRKQLVENGWVKEEDFNKKFSHIVGEEENEIENEINEKDVNEKDKKKLEKLLDQADIVYSEYSGQVSGEYGFQSPDEAMEYLSEIEKGNEHYKEAQNLIMQLDAIDFIDDEDEEDEEDEEELIDLLKKASLLYSKYSGYSNKNHVDGEYQFIDPDEAMEYLLDIEEDSKYYDEAQELIDEIDDLVDNIGDEDDKDEDDEEDDIFKYEKDHDIFYKEWLQKNYDNWKDMYKTYLTNNYAHLKNKNIPTKKEEDDDSTYYKAKVYFKNTPQKEFEVLIKCGETDENEDIFYYVEDEEDIKDLMKKDNDENFIVKKYEKTELKKSTTPPTSYNDIDYGDRYPFY